MNTRILVAVLLPLILGAAIVAAFCALDKTRFVVKGIVAPYFATVALLFALFASLLTTEAWQKVTRANTLLIQEANSARGGRMIQALSPHARGSDAPRRLTASSSPLRELAVSRATLSAEGRLAPLPRQPV